MSGSIEDLFFSYEEFAAEELFERSDAVIAQLAFENAHVAAVKGCFLEACLGLFRCLVELGGYTHWAAMCLAKRLLAGYIDEIKELFGGRALCFELKACEVAYQDNPFTPVMSLEEIPMATFLLGLIRASEFPGGAA